MKLKSIVTVFGLLTLGTAICSAESEPVKHDFGTIIGGKTLILSNGNKTGTSDFTTYTCTGSANSKFSSMSENSLAVVGILLPEANDMVTTTAIPDVQSLTIFTIPSGTRCTNIEIYLSRDSVHWIGPMEAEYSKGQIFSYFVPGTYYVRIKNTTSTDILLHQIDYQFGSCNCILNIPQ